MVDLSSVVRCLWLEFIGGVGFVCMVTYLWLWLLNVGMVSVLIYLWLEFADDLVSLAVPL
jgi:hypothetical protein